MCFDLAYYSEGAITIPQVYELPVHLRYFYMKCLNNAKESEKDQMESQEKFDGKIVRKA
jgi:hypothetical protein